MLVAPRIALRRQRPAIRPARPIRLLMRLRSSGRGRCVHFRRAVMLGEGVLFPALPICRKRAPAGRCCREIVFRAQAALADRARRVCENAEANILATLARPVAAGRAAERVREQPHLSELPDRLFREMRRRFGIWAVSENEGRFPGPLLRAAAIPRRPLIPTPRRAFSPAHETSTARAAAVSAGARKERLNSVSICA